MVDIFREVEEDLRAEKMRSLAIRYGTAAVGIVLLIVGGTGAWQGWRWWQAKQNGQFAESYLTNLENAQRQRARGGSGDSGTVAADMDHLGRTAPNGYRALAGLTAAALQSETLNQQAALKTWDQVANEVQASSELRQLATLMWVAHQIDTGDPNQLRSRLEAITAAASFWTPLARELLAVLDIREGKQDLARGELKRVTSGSLVPTGLSGRAASLLTSLGGQ